MRLCHVKTSSSNLAYLTKKRRELIATTATLTLEETRISPETFIWHKMQEVHKILIITRLNLSLLILLHHAIHMSIAQLSMYINEKIYYVTNAEYQVTLLPNVFLIHHYLELSQYI